MALSGAFDVEGRFVVEMRGNAGWAGRLQRSRDLERWEEVGRVVLEGGTARVVEEGVTGDGRWYRWVGE